MGDCFQVLPDFQYGSVPNIFNAQSFSLTFALCFFNHCSSFLAFKLSYGVVCNFGSLNYLEELKSWGVGLDWKLFWCGKNLGHYYCAMGMFILLRC